MSGQQATGQPYTIRVREKLDERWTEWFDGMTISTDGEGTILTGHIADQAALHGMIATISRLGLHLVAVTPRETSEGVE